MAVGDVCRGAPADVRLKALTRDGRLPFVFEASGTETHFTNGFDPEPRARQHLRLPQARDAGPDWSGQPRTSPRRRPGEPRSGKLPAARHRAAAPGPDHGDHGHREEPGRPAFRPILVQMATGAGKTYTAVTESYRLLKWGGFNRILFLVDRNNLAEQTLAEFQNYRTPGRRPPVHRAVQRRQAHRRRHVDSHQGRDLDDPAGLQGLRERGGPRGRRPRHGRRSCPTSRSRSPTTPTCRPRRSIWSSSTSAHRSIYGVWRGVLEYFDAHIVGLTATPGKQTFGFFRQNLVARIHLPAVGRRRGQRRLRHLPDQDRDQRAGLHDRGRHDRARSTPDPQRAAGEARRGPGVHRASSSTAPSRPSRRSGWCWRRSATGCSPRSSRAVGTVPKTLIFAKDDDHAEEIVTHRA